MFSMPEGSGTQACGVCMVLPPALPSDPLELCSGSVGRGRGAQEGIQIVANVNEVQVL